ncbi:MAG TPA: hypothetical protein VER11_34255 [Polyangiaceae bacterium]|nr:hypothetical protein [Polyangiaceae bacterium]
MNAALEIQLDTAEDVTEAYDALARNPSIEMKVRETGLGATMVLLFQHGQQIAVGRGRGLVNALANALEEVGSAGEEPR